MVAGEYDAFKVSIYTRAYEVEKMADDHWLDSTWQVISQQLTVDKIYLETHRDLLIVPDETLQKAKRFFQSKGLEVCGGITYTISEPNLFETFSYSNPEHRRKVQEIAEHTARNFDEFILDDFFFTSAKSTFDIEAKGSRSWTEYRLQLMTEAGRELVLGPARRVNPKVKVIIKYPNWYDHFQGLGFNLEKGPFLFDGIWTGTETRDPGSAQHLQNYLSYNIIRYFNNLRPGYNGGGWVDCGGIQMSMDRYAEQLHLTALAKAPEVALFAYNQLLDVPLADSQRAAWQNRKDVSWRFDEMKKPVVQPDGSKVKPTTMARIADVVLHQSDALVRQLGNPVGIKSYKRFHSRGEAFLQNYLGMVGLPMDMHQSYPTDQRVVLLTAQAAGDPDLVELIRRQLLSGRDVVITTGLLALEQDRLADIAELQIDNSKALVNDFGHYGQSTRDILIPQLHYYTNDSWEIVSAGRPLNGGVSGYPILHRALYGGGNLYVLTIPDDFGQLYDYPQAALRPIRRILSQDLPAYLDAPSKVSLFLYDNRTLVVENFNDEPVTVSIVMGEQYTELHDLLSSETLRGAAEQQAPSRFFRNGLPKENLFTLTLPPHSYRGFKY
ncbi:MAG: hypothetical protein KBT20_00145 [Bacteroidales bacterium]|nr:hypothetical protein [Candidatus Liminaster caballi]